MVQVTTRSTDWYSAIIRWHSVDLPLPAGPAIIINRAEEWEAWTMSLIGESDSTQKSAIEKKQKSEKFYATRGGE